MVERCIYLGMTLSMIAQPCSRKCSTADTTLRSNFGSVPASLKGTPIC